MSSIKCRVVSAILTIQILANPVTTVSSNSPLCENGTVSLAANGGTLYQWSGINNFSATGDVVTISNAQLTQSGKYYVLVTNAAGCVHMDSVTININPTPVAATSFSNSSICAGDNIQLFASGGSTYKWLPASGLSSDVIANPVASPADTIQYKVIVSNQFSCSDTAFVDINAIEKPKANAGPDKSVIEGSPVQLSGIVSGQNISYFWSPAVTINNTQVLQPIVTPTADADYTLHVVSNEGCGTAIDKVHVFVYKDVFVPTAFTPNNDGTNDTWNIPALNAFSDVNVSVYNRYGQLVFQTERIYHPWNGMYKGVPQPSGIYVYIINLKQTARIVKGTVLLIR
jgi:gliding motility-associated-like protein